MAQQRKTADKLMGSAQTVREKHDEFLFPSVINYYKEPLVLARGEGRWITDIEGKEYLDFFGIGP